MAKRRFAAYPSQGTITIANGKEYPIPRSGTFINVKTADQAFKIVLDGTDQLSAAANRRFTFNEEAEFEHVMVVNDSGSDLTFQLEIGYGGVESDDVSITGTVNVDIGADIVSGTTNALRVYDGYSSAINSLLSGSSHGLIQGMHTMGANYDSTTASGATDLIDSTTDNPSSGDGIIIRTFATQSDNNGGYNILSINGNAILEHDTDAGRAFQQPLSLPMFVPAGQAVAVTHSHATGFSAVTWDAV